MDEPSSALDTYSENAVFEAMNQQVKQNIERFPDDFMFQLEKEEVDFFDRKIDVMR